MTIEIPNKIYRPCSTCSDDTCVFHGDKNTHEICTDYKDKRLAKAIEEIKKIDLIVHDGINHYYKDGEEVISEVLEILKRNI